jgi:hypothetical protein
VCIGGDWGNQSWGVAGMNDPDNPRRVILLDIWDIKDEAALILSEVKKENPHIKGFAEKIRQWKAKRAVLDAGYGKDRNWDLLQTFPGKVFSCFYPSLSTDATKNVQDAWTDKDFKVSVDRTMTLKIMAKMFREQEFVIPAWVAQNPLFERFITHITNLVLVRDIEEDELTKKEVIKERVATLPGGDHFGHATNYLTIGLREMQGGKSSFFV